MDEVFKGMNGGCRIIMALWRTRTLTPEQKAQIAEEQEDQEENFVMLDNSGPIQEVEDAKMTKLCSAEFAVSVSDQAKFLNYFQYSITLCEGPNSQDVEHFIVHCRNMMRDHVEMTYYALAFDR